MIGTKARSFAAYPVSFPWSPCPYPLPLFTGVHGRHILRSS
jgi:hypothetical protein